MRRHGCHDPCDDFVERWRTAVHFRASRELRDSQGFQWNDSVFISRDKDFEIVETSLMRWLCIFWLVF